jgi:phosphoribosylaminoimidazolecarboxamide formyltransferase/IMP cyclohydrolase
LNINNAFIEKTGGVFDLFKEKLIQFGIKIYTSEDFNNAFDLIPEISKAGGSDFKGIDLVALELPREFPKLEESMILNSLEPWKLASIYACIKNYRNSVIVVDTDDFSRIISSLDECGDITLQDRRMLSLKALYRVLRLNSLIHKDMSELFASEKFETLILEEIIPLRYGENPHQLAYLAKLAKSHAFFDFMSGEHLVGLSYNNIIDVHLALTTLKYLSDDFVVRVHHGTIVEARTGDFDFKGARGVVAAAFVNDELLKALEGNDLDVLILPGSKEVQTLKVRRFIEFKGIPSVNVEKEYRFLDGNFLIQNPDDISNMRFFSEENDVQYRFANAIVSLSRSMACCIFKDYGLISIGSGQPEQIDALEIAIRQSNRKSKDVRDSICAFDGPVRDEEVVQTLIKAGVKIVIEPGGVKEDRIVRKELEDSGIELVFSGKRRYKH